MTHKIYIYYIYLDNSYSIHYIYLDDSYSIYTSTYTLMTHTVYTLHE